MNAYELIFNNKTVNKQKDLGKKYETGIYKKIIDEECCPDAEEEIKVKEVYSSSSKMNNLTRLNSILKKNDLIKSNNKTVIKEDDSDKDESVDTNEISEGTKSDVDSVESHKGYMYKITSDNQIKKLYFKLINKDLFCKVFG